MIESQTTYLPAEDAFERYYTEKLWEMIPSIYRYEDGVGPRPDVLRSLVSVLARQAAILRRSQDRLWDDQFIDLCDDWAVPYLGELLGTRLVSASNLRGRRVDVAKTIYYRRRKGTLRVLEELISDIAQWEGKVVEQFQRLGRPRHGLDPAPSPYAGKNSGSQPGGWADIRRPGIAELAGGPFEEYHHFADIRQHRGSLGRYGIPKLAFYLYRLQSFPVTDVSPFSRGDGLGFSFDPSGRSIPLFNRRGRGEGYVWQEWQSAQEWEVPGPIRCRLLGDVNYQLDLEKINQLMVSPGLTPAARTDLESWVGWRIKGDARLKQSILSLPSAVDLITPPNFEVLKALMKVALTPDSGKSALYPITLSVEIDGSAVPGEEVAAGDLTGWNTSDAPPEKRVVISPEKGHLAFASLPPTPTENLTVNYHYGFSGNFGAGTYDRRAVEEVAPDFLVQDGNPITPANLQGDKVTQIEDNRTYSGLPNLNGISNCRLQAANGKRPYIRLASDWLIDTDSNTDAMLILDGLWIGADGAVEIRLVGDYECVVIRNCTLDPGGGIDILGNAMASITLSIAGKVEQLIVDHSITGPIQVVDDGDLESLVLCDSVVQHLGAGIALSMPDTAAKLDRVTVFGESDWLSLQASEVLLTGASRVRNTQTGCFRFSAAPIGSRLPRPYPYELLAFDQSGHWFTSREFGHPGYAQISESAPEVIRRGAENGSEIGVFSALANPIKLDSLQLKVAEYMPFGLIPIFINET